jgi:hypothetical protein
MGVTHHNGVSVFGSGYMVGQKGVETLVVDKSGYVQSGRLYGSEAFIHSPGAMGGGTTLKIDAGTVSFSGMVKRSVSTALSSITALFARPAINVNLSTWIQASGYPNMIQVSKSGHAFDLWSLHAANESGQYMVTSCGVSGVIHWLAIGT